MTCVTNPCSIPWHHLCALSLPIVSAQQRLGAQDHLEPVIHCSSEVCKVLPRYVSALALHELTCKIS